jgi:hypothetical protein
MFAMAVVIKFVFGCFVEIRIIWWKGERSMHVPAMLSGRERVLQGQLCSFERLDQRIKPRSERFVVGCYRRDTRRTFQPPLTPRATYNTLVKERS